MLDVQQLPELRVPKWPFFVANALMLGLAYYLFYWQAKFPLSQWEVIACCVCVMLGAFLGVLPYLLEYRAILKYGALVRLIESSSLCAATEKIQNLEGCVAQIGTATQLLQTTQSQADKTAALATQITERMAAEVAEFTEFMQKANDGEKATLRLEAEKLRQAEKEWVMVLATILDHVYALNRAAERSGQENLIRQLGQFQNACRDTARRVGLSPVQATPGEPFDADRQQLPEGETGEGVIAEVLVCGYSYQGRPIRRPLVRLEVADSNVVSAVAGAADADSSDGENQTSLHPV